MSNMKRPPEKAPHLELIEMGTRIFRLFADAIEKQMEHQTISPAHRGAMTRQLRRIAIAIGSPLR